MLVGSDVKLAAVNEMADLAYVAESQMWQLWHLGQM